jgi:RNA polymerase-binding transcription factor DksA
MEKHLCEICGKQIPAARLQALPETKRCVECARLKGSDMKSIRRKIGMDPDTYQDLLNATRN